MISKRGVRKHERMKIHLEMMSLNDERKTKLSHLMSTGLYSYKDLRDWCNSGAGFERKIDEKYLEFAVEQRYYDEKTRLSKCRGA